MIIELLINYGGQYMMLELCSESAVSKFGVWPFFEIYPTVPATARRSDLGTRSADVALICLDVSRKEERGCSQTAKDRKLMHPGSPMGRLTQYIPHHEREETRVCGPAKLDLG